MPCIYGVSDNFCLAGIFPHNISNNLSDVQSRIFQILRLFRSVTKRSLSRVGSPNDKSWSLSRRRASRRQVRRKIRNCYNFYSHRISFATVRVKSHSLARAACRVEHLVYLHPPHSCCAWRVRNNVKIGRGSCRQCVAHQRICWFRAVERKEVSFLD